MHCVHCVIAIYHHLRFGVILPETQLVDVAYRLKVELYINNKGSGATDHR